MGKARGIGITGLAPAGTSDRAKWCISSHHLLTLDRDSAFSTFRYQVTNLYTLEFRA